MAHTHSTQDDFLVSGTPDRRSSPSYSPTGSLESLQLLLQAPELSVIPDGEVTLEAAHLLSHVVDPSSDGDEEEEGLLDGASKPHRQRSWNPKRWFEKASPWHIFPIMVFSVAIFTSTMGARSEIYVHLACAYHRPEYYSTPIISPPNTLPTNPTVPSSRSSHPLLVSHASPILLPDVIRTRNATSPMINLPSGNTQCSSDPVVMAAVARLVTVTTLVVGILTCLVSGWWGQFSDRRGRKLVLVCTIMSVQLSELNLIFVTLTQASIPGGYWFLLATSVTDGLFGGIATAGAVLHAYVSDCTEPHKRNRVFSMYMGFLFIGMTVGPTFGSFMVRMTQDLLTPFYIALVAHCFLAFYMWFIIPESLSPALMRQHRDKHSLERRERNDLRHGRNTSLAGSVKSLLTLFRPLGVFLPRRRDADEHRPGRDWNLTLLAIAYAITTSYISLSQFKSQYAIAVFGWTAEDLGYWLSLIGGSRALYLIIILPFLTKFLRSKEMSRTVSPNLTDSAPNAERRSRSSSQVRHTADAAQGGVKAYNTAQLDVRIARVSVFIEVVSFGVIILSMGPQSWTLGSVVGSFGAGLQPSLQSLALFLTGGQENGKLFGALAVVSALGGQVVGPAVFGAIYVSTVGSFPKAIFLAAITGSIIAFTAVSLIRLPVREIRVVSERQDEEA